MAGNDNNKNFMVIPFYTIIINFIFDEFFNMTSTNIIILIIVGPYSIL